MKPPRGPLSRSKISATATAHRYPPRQALPRLPAESMEVEVVQRVLAAAANPDEDRRLQEHRWVLEIVAVPC